MFENPKTFDPDIPLEVRREMAAAQADAARFQINLLIAKILAPFAKSEFPKTNQQPADNIKPSNT